MGVMALYFWDAPKSATIKDTSMVYILQVHVKYKAL
jgi:hypothetical protein